MSELKVPIKIITKNPKARGDYFIQEKVEAGVVLQGTEVKSIRNKVPNIRDSYVDVKRKSGALEAWIYNMHIAPYDFGNRFNHEPTRPRKLLLHRHQIDRLFGAIHQKGQTVVPLMVYLKSGRIKLEIGLGKGKKKGDRRDTVKKRQAEREMDRARKAR